MAAYAIAIDGPAGAGKSTVSKALANRLHYELLDTGAMYRAFTWAVLASGVADARLWPTIVREHQFGVHWNGESSEVTCDGLDISVEIRGKAVTESVSAVSALPEIRQFAVLEQQRLVDKALARGHGIVLEGRDIGTTVLPAADFKFFLTAEPAARAARRAAEIGGDADVIEASIRERDRADSEREFSPLRQAPDALVVDATSLTAEEVVDLMAARIEAGRG